MIDVQSFQTFSAALAFFAILALLYGRFTAARILFRFREPPATPSESRAGRAPSRRAARKGGKRPMLNRVIPAIAIVLLIGASAAWFLRPAHGKAATTATVIQRMQRELQRVLAGLGPNSTLHVTLRVSDNSAAGSHIGDEWISFDASGRAVAFTNTQRTIDGHVYSFATVVNGHTVYTDEASGQTRDTGPVSAITAAALLQNYSKLNALAAASPGSRAPQLSYAGHTVYEIKSGANPPTSPWSAC